ncbi:MAG: MCP four helix bundle domain-containing protein [Candidatus Latescibacteria bacterium]|nr:MCP four helix bundle domain-containing protein [Candidatus Latescibacterota bacterium]
MKLFTKIAVLVIGVLALAVVSSVSALFSSNRLGELVVGMATENLSSIRAAEELEIALLEQRGLVSSYILDDGDPSWLEELKNKQQNFSHWLSRARETAHTAREQQLIDQIAEVYRLYDAERSEVIRLYDQGRVPEAKAKILRDVQALYNQAYELCEDYLQENEQYIETRMADAQAQVQRNTLVQLVVGVGLTIVLCVVLLWFFFQGIFLPLRQMARDAHAFSPDHAPADPGTPQDELRAVGFYLKTLMSDVSQTRTSLERSRSQLLQAEKLASVGKLAASVAHEIRNPLTSLKMRLFSLRQAFGADPLHRDDFQVVSEEVARLERVIRNFLEFSRPPELQLQPQHLAPLLDRTLELCGHRLFEKDLLLTRRDGPGLPRILADADQLKQVFINLLNNASEALPEGGQLQLSTAMEADPEGRPMAVVRFTDSGPGVPAEVQPHIFEPFFTTKDEGTGLGLCIAARIMARHQGRLLLESSTPQGSTFAVWIPAVQEEEA